MTTSLGEAAAATMLGAAGAQVIRLAATSTPRRAPNLSAVLRALAERGITRLLVEGGARVASSFVAAGLVDEFWLLRGESSIGADGVAALGRLPLASITRSPGFHVRGSENLDKDTLTIYERV